MGTGEWKNAETAMAYGSDQSMPVSEAVVEEVKRPSKFKTILWSVLVVIGVAYIGLALYVTFVENEEVGLQMLFLPLGIVVTIVGGVLLYFAYQLIKLLIYLGLKVLKYVVPAVFLYYFLKMIITAYIQTL